MKLLFFCLSAVAVAANMNCPGSETSKLVRDTLEPIATKCQNMDNVCSESCKSAVKTGQAFMETLVKDPSKTKILTCWFDVQQQGGKIKEFISNSLDSTFAQDLIADVESRMGDFNFDGIRGMITQVLDMLKGGLSDIMAKGPEIMDMLKNIDLDNIKARIENAKNNGGQLQGIVQQILQDIQTNPSLNLQQIRNSVPWENQVRDGQGELNLGGIFGQLANTFKDKLQKFNPAQVLESMGDKIPMFDEIKSRVESFKDKLLNGGLGNNGGGLLNMVDINGIRDRFQGILSSIGLDGINLDGIRGQLGTLRDSLLNGQGLDALKDLVQQFMGGGVPQILEDPTMLKSCAASPEEVAVETLKLEESIQQTITIEEANTNAVTSANDNIQVTTTKDKITAAANTEASSAASLLPGLAVALAAAGSTLLV